MKLRYTLPALADLDSVLDYIAAHSPQGARRVQARIQAIIDLLVLHPGIGSRTDDPAIRRMTTLPYPYLIVSTRRMPPCRREGAFDLKGACMSAAKTRGSELYGDHYRG